MIRQKCTFNVVEIKIKIKLYTLNIETGIRETERMELKFEVNILRFYNNTMKGLLYRIKKKTDCNKKQSIQ